MIYHVYLAGPISKCSYDGATNWREYARDLLGPHIVALSPMRGKSYLQAETSLGDTYPDYVMSTDKGIMGRDTFDVRRSDVLLVNFLGATRVSVGTVMEIGMAHALNIPVVLVIEQTGNPHEHAMLREACAWRVDSLDEGIRIVNSVLEV